MIRASCELRRARLYAAYDEAAADPVFMAEMGEVTKAFDVAVRDGLEEPESELDQARDSDDVRSPLM